ncbi:hypothetical protein [Streptomyces sp. NPDC059850]|uniref:hypothetical protein n=1 Tax=Streptomyces sp. NPDC059850 TaxID=3346970 RepID=UPI003658B775
MGRGRAGRAGDEGLRMRKVRATTRAALRRVVPLLAAVLWVAPSCVHSGGDHPPISVGCPHQLIAEQQLVQPPLDPLPDALPAGDGTRPPGDGSGNGSDDCVAGPRGGNPALVPAPVPPPAPAGLRPPGGPRGTDSVRAPPDPHVHALGLHQLQVLRT